MNKKERESMLIELWLQRPQETRQNYIHVHSFDQWVRENHIYLLKGIAGSSYSGASVAHYTPLPQKRVSPEICQGQAAVAFLAL